MENGKNGMIWKVITVIIIPILLLIGNSVIANDRLRQDGDTAIKTEMSTDRKELAKELKEISSKLASIETELKYIRKERGA